MRKFAVAAVTAALAGTIAVTVPAGTAHAAPATLPDPISGRCAANESTDCWRYITFSDATTPTPDPPEVQGSRIILNHAGLTNLGNGVWWNTPLTMTGNAVSVSFNAYLEGGDPNYHGSGMAFALIDSYMTPAPIPYFPTSSATSGPAARVWASTASTATTSRRARPTRRAPTTWPSPSSPTTTTTGTTATTRPATST